MQTLISQPGLRITQRDGLEGPRHDPYSWQELTVERAGRSVQMRTSGLGYTKLWVDGVPLPTIGDQDNAAQGVFKAVTGLDVDGWFLAIQKLQAHRHGRCNKCGSHHLDWVSGHPGEELLICHACHEVAGSTFNEAAVI